MFRMHKASSPAPMALLTSGLYDADTFYPRFTLDLQRCKREAIIESPFITRKRMAILLPIFKTLRARHVSIIINTRQPGEHEDNFMRHEAQQAISSLQNIGVTVLHTGGHHRKLAILDRRILFEGSLNILSQSDSCEIMRRIESQVLTQEMINFTKLSRFIQ